MSNHAAMKRVALLVAGLIVLVGSTAGANDHRAPRATLHLAGEAQQGHLYHADGWAEPSDEPGYCEMSFGHGSPVFRKPLKRAATDEIVVRLHKVAMPREVEAQSWPRVDRRGQATGEPKPLPWLLRPRMANGVIKGWEVVVLPPPSVGHLYLGVGAYWADEDGCGGGPVDLGSQYAAWSFDVLTR